MSKKILRSFLVILIIIITSGCVDEQGERVTCPDGTIVGVREPCPIIARDSSIDIETYEPPLDDMAQSPPDKYQPIKPECVVNTECKNNEYCSNEKCVRLACQYTKNHVCVECLIDNNCRPDERCSTNQCLKLDCGAGHAYNHGCIDCMKTTDCAYDKECIEKQCLEIKCESSRLRPSDHQCVDIRFDVKNFITPHSQTVYSKLDELTGGDYSEDSFGKNLVDIYYYVSAIPYEYDISKWGKTDYWQLSDETIQTGTGDCEDHAILLTSMIESLLYKSTGQIPPETVYVITGQIDSNYDGSPDGGHAWVLIDASKLPKSGYTLSIVDFGKENVPGRMSVIVDDIYLNSTVSPKGVVFDPSDSPRKTPPLSVMFSGRKLVELEATWEMPISYYENRVYPYIGTPYEMFNSQEYYLVPELEKTGEMPSILDDVLAYINGLLNLVVRYIKGLF